MKINLFKYKKHKTLHEFEGDYVINDSSSFTTLESYKIARTNIMFSLPKTDDGKLILVSSSEPGEGKTTTTINLAYTFSQTNAKVLVIDCDMRKPRVHRYLKTSNNLGLSNVLCGFCTVDEAIQKNVFGSLDCLTVGEIPLNSAELLMSDVMKGLLDDLAKRYDYIFIDTPPIITVTDAMILAPYASGVVLVVRQNFSSYDMLDKTVDSLKRSNVKILGFVMTYVEKSSKGKYYTRKRYGGRGSYTYTYQYSDSKTKNKQ